MGTEVVTRALLRVPALDRTALRDTVQALVFSRALVWAAAMLAILRFGVEQTIDAPPDVTRFGWAGTLLTTPTGTWDAGHYVAIVDRGYDVVTAPRSQGEPPVPHRRLHRRLRALRRHRRACRRRGLTRQTPAGRGRSPD